MFWSDVKNFMISFEGVFEAPHLVHLQRKIEKRLDEALYQIWFVAKLKRIVAYRLSG